jgi:hypothetical protein
MTDQCVASNERNGHEESHRVKTVLLGKRSTSAHFREGVVRRFANDEGAATAEYAVATMANVGRLGHS